MILTLPEHPGGHAALALHNGCLQRVHQFAAQLRSQRKQKRLIDQEPDPSVGKAVEVSFHMLELHSDARAETAEEEPAGSKDAPNVDQHVPEPLLTRRKVQYRRTEDRIRKGIGEWHALDRRRNKALGR